MAPADKSISYMKMLCSKYNLSEPKINYTRAEYCSAGGDENNGPVYDVSVNRIQEETVYGFLEYKRLQHLWSHLGLLEFIIYPYPDKNQSRFASNITGDLAIHCVTLHEFAHIAHWCLDNGEEDKPHGPEYQSWLRRIIRENPYREEFWLESVKSWERFL